MAFFVGDPSAPTRFGEDVAATGDNTGLFLKLFGGEVFAAFSEATIMAGRHYVKSISQGKSHQFPKTWKVSAEYHSAGQEMLGQTTDETERLISVDGLLVAHFAVYDLDVAMSHFDVRSRYTEECGRAIGRVFDQNVMRAIIKTAIGTDSANNFGTTSPFPGGTVITSSDIVGTLTATAGSPWWEVMRHLRVDADQANIPASDALYLAVPPVTYDATLYSQAADTATNPFLFANRELTFGGSFPGLRGVEMLMSNLIPQANDSANPDVRAKYRADFSATLGVAWHKDAVGTVQLIGLGMETTRDVRRQEDFVVCKMAVGHGALRNEGAWQVTA